MSIQEIEELLYSSISEYTIELTSEQIAEQYALKKGVSLEKAYQKMDDYSSISEKIDYHQNL